MAKPEAGPQKNKEKRNYYFCLVSRASRIFPRMRMRVRKWAGEGKEKYVWAHLPGFRDSVECAECLPRVHNVNVISGKYFVVDDRDCLQKIP